jgi:hypothetical protein
MAEFSEAEVQKFEAVSKEMDDGRKDMNERIATMRRALPDPEQQDAFFAWVFAGENARNAELNAASVTAEEFVQLIDSANLVDFKSKPIDKLLHAMDMGGGPYIPIGFDGCILYRLTLEAFGLYAHPRPEGARPTAAALLPRSQLHRPAPRARGARQPPKGQPVRDVGLLGRERRRRRPGLRLLPARRARGSHAPRRQGGVARDRRRRARRVPLL